MNLPAIKTEWVVVGAVVGAVLVAANAKRIAKAAGEVPVDVFMGWSEGFFGLPDTRTETAQQKCAAAKASGDCWEASFQCPALDYLRCLREKYF